MNDIVYAAQLLGGHGSQPQVHEKWEYVFCLSGAGECSLGGKRLSFSKGDMVAVPPMTPHLGSADKGCKIIQLLIDQPAPLLKEPCVLRVSCGSHLQAAFEGALYHFRSGHPSKAHLLTAYGGLIACYLAAYRTGPTQSLVVAEIEMSIRTRFSDPSYELEAYLHSLPFNYDYLRKLFQREMGVTPLQYLNNMRLQTAAEALISSERASGSVTDIARMCGFREPLYFSRMFKKKYGQSPTYYAASMEEKPGAYPDPGESGAMPGPEDA